MSKRDINPEIKALYDAGKRPYSISKLNAIDGCLKEAFYSYVVHMRDQGLENIYGIMGGCIHDVLEKIYNNEATGADLLPALQKDLDNADFVGVDFPRDFKGGTTIRDGWIADMTDFCKNFTKLEDGDFVTEEGVILKINDDRYLIGYIDLIQIIDETTKTVNIYDFKTSTKFKKDDLTHHGRQLVVYGMAMEQAGYKVQNLAWIMLKYVQVTYMGYARANSKNKTQITKVVRRGKLAHELYQIVTNMMHAAGYTEIDIDFYLQEFLEKNSLQVLPAGIREQFNVEQYIEYYPFTVETQAEAMEYINSRADKFEELLAEGEDAWKPMDIDKSSVFYCNNLCNYRNLCPHIKAYNDLQRLQHIEDEALF